MADDFIIRIRADDTAAVAAIKRLQAALGKVTEPVEKVQKRLSRLGTAGQGGLNKLNKGFHGVENATRGVVDRITQIVPGLAAISGAASLAGLTALSVKFGNFGFNLNKSSKLLGMNAQDLAAWHVAARQAGVSAQEFDSSMSGSQMAIRGAAFGANPEAMMYLQKMGVQIQRNRDGTIDYLKTQQLIMRALERQKNVQAQRAAAGALGMGALLPMIQQGTWEADKVAAIKKGLVPTPEEIARAQQFHRDIGGLENSVSGLSNSIGSKLEPIIDPLVHGFSTWLDANRVDIANELGDAVKKITDQLGKVDWRGMYDDVNKVVDKLGGFSNVLEGIVAIKVGSAILGWASALKKLGGAALGLEASGAMGILGRLGVAGVAAYGGLKVAKALGLPDTNTQKGIDDIRRGDWGRASVDLPAADYIGALAHHAYGFGKSNGEIADELQAKYPALPAPQKGDTLDREKYLFGRLKAAGYTDAQAAGQIGSLLQENSTLDPGVVNGKSGAAGIAQWLGPRARQYEKKYGHSVAQGTLAEQTDFYLWEMENAYSDTDRRIRMSNNPEEVAEIQTLGFERPGANEMHMGRRQRNAAAVYAGLGGAEGSTPQNAGGGVSQADLVASFRDAIKEVLKIDLTVHAPHGTRAETKTPEGYMPTRVNYDMTTDFGAIP
ncbi:MAG: phage tail tip lysozyme [Bordetella sp.]|uniref:phage tail tip lysozyme n=1 Tax=Bordetella sp. TaxID=28081 RepID=UPI003F7B9C10